MDFSAKNTIKMQLKLWGNDMNRLTQLIESVLNEDEYMGYTLPDKRVLIRPNKMSKSTDDAYEVQVLPHGKWWKFPSEDECCTFAITMGGAGGSDYPIYAVRGDEIVHLVFDNESLKTHVQLHDEEKARQKRNTPISSFEYPEYDTPPEPLSWDGIAELRAAGRIPGQPATSRRP